MPQGPRHARNTPFQNDTGFVGWLGLDPNTLIMDQGRTHFDRGFTGKLTAFTPRRTVFTWAPHLSTTTGLPFARLLFIDGFNQGPLFVRATPVGHPGGVQTQFDYTLDLRVSREFSVKTGVLSGYLDTFNLSKASNNTQESALTGGLFLARVPLAIEAPRTARLGLWSGGFECNCPRRSRVAKHQTNDMDLEKTIADIEWLERLFALPDTRRFRLADREAANRKHDERYAANPWFRLWKRYGVCTDPDRASRA